MAVEQFWKCHNVLTASGVCFNSVGAGIYSDGVILGESHDNLITGLLESLKEGFWVDWWEVPHVQGRGVFP